MKDRIVGDFSLKFTVPNPKDEIIQINQECNFITGQNGYITPYKLHLGLYSLKELDKKYYIYPEHGLYNTFTTVMLEKGLLKISSPVNIFLDSYLSDCSGFEYNDIESLK
ncbi:Hypothetical protein CINCED_3A009984, partial [Cinara cedri]